MCLSRARREGFYPAFIELNVQLHKRKEDEF
jgi:hypothetical protein